jgi:hypothetical protein
MHLSSTAGPLPSVSKSAGFPLSAGMAETLKRTQGIDHNQMCGADPAIFENENTFFRCRQRNRHRAVMVEFGVAGAALEPIAEPFSLRRPEMRSL